MKQLRLDLLHGKKPESCLLCWEDEDKFSRGSRREHENTLWSRRLDLEKVVSKTKDSGHLDTLPVYWDLRLGNSCNLKCIMCSAENSSLWMKDLSYSDKFQNHSILKNQEAFRWGEDPKLWSLLSTEIHQMKELYFSGGEPLLSKEHFQLLNMAVEKGAAKNIHLRYDTNGLLVSERHFSLWKNFKSVYINLSIDGIGAMVEYIRYPTRWSHLEKIFDKFENSNLQNIDVNPQFSLSAVNAIGYLDFIDWKLKKKFTKIGSHRVTSDEVSEAHVVDRPEYLSLRSLLPEQKDFVKTKYTEFIGRLSDFSGLVNGPKALLRIEKKLKDFISYMYEEDWSYAQHQTLKHYLDALDKQRGTNFHEVAPWLNP